MVIALIRTRSNTSSQESTSCIFIFLKCSKGIVYNTRAKTRWGAPARSAHFVTSLIAGGGAQRELTAASKGEYASYLTYKVDMLLVALASGLGQNGSS
jgi:hypothetical protein